jgi:hypothetical protein
MYENPQPTVTTAGPRPTAAQLDHERWMARQRPEQPMIIKNYGIQPTIEEVEQERLRRLRPAGTTPGDYRRALAAIANERPLVSARLAGLRDQENSLLLVGTALDIQAIRVKIDEATIELERLGRLETHAVSGLARAEVVEAEELRALAAQVPAAQKTVESYRKSAAKIAEHAAAIAAIIATEEGAEAALRVLQLAAARLPGHSTPAALPVAPNGRAWRVSVTIPGHVVPPTPAFNVSQVYGR